MKLSIIIPCYNEEKTISQLLHKVINNSYSNKEIIIVDDNSSDNSRKLIEESANSSNIIKVILHDRNLGKGACINSALKIADGEIILIQDADLEYEPDEHINIIKPILENKADVVYGSRFKNNEVVKTVFFWQKFGNLFLTQLCNLFTNLNLTDMETCFKAFKKNLLENIIIKEKRFGFEPEITIKLAKTNCRFAEIEINYNARSYDEGKKINWKDGIKAIYCIFKYSLFTKI